MATRSGGRELPGRLSFAADSPLMAVAGALALGIMVVATRVPLATHHLLNWDAVQFALGIQHFDLAHHQPHPPGYIGYIALGRLLLPAFGDPNTALVALSIAGEVGGVIAAFFFARALFGTPAAWITAAALMTSPLFWYYGEAANTYALEPLLALGVAWFSWRAWNGDRRVAVPTALVLAAGGAIRPSAAVLLAPMAVYSVWRGARPGLLPALLAGVVATAAWLVPLAVLAGGMAAVWHDSTALGADVTAGTAIWRAGPAGLLTTTEGVARGIGWELGGFVVLGLFGLGIAPRLTGVDPRLPAGWARFCWLWSLPALLTFLFIHIGQVVYVGIFTPAVTLSLGPAVMAGVKAVGRPALAAPATAAAAVLSVLVFLLPPVDSLAGQQRAHDVWVEQLQATVRSYDPVHTVLVTDAYAPGSYRTSQYYLPEYHRVAVAVDRMGRLGVAFADSYTPSGLDETRPLQFPPETDTYLFVDRSVVDSVVGNPQRLRTIKLSNGARIYVWQGPAPTVRHGVIWLGSPAGRPRGLS
ncbi:MAG TPA: glycosyltransferase family 39 protein [Candidatus Dormibacteraeota bacterium]